MFIDRINNLTLCSEEAAEVFPNIKALWEQPDNSFLATLRAIMPKRMAPTDILRFGLERHTADAGFLEMTLKKKIQAVLRAAVTEKHCLVVISLDGKDHSLFDAIKTRVTEVYTSLKLLPVVSQYLSQHGCQKASFVSEADRIAVVIGTAISLSDWHYIQSVLPKLLPWYFAEYTESDSDTAILRTLTKKDPREYITAMERVAIGLDMRALLVSRKLDGLQREFLQVRIDTSTRKIEGIEREIEKLNKSISQMIAEKFEEQIILMGLNNMNDPKDLELTEFFTHNKALHIIKAEKGIVEYVATGYLNSYDPEFLDSCLNNSKSYFHDNYAGAIISANDTIKLIKAVFNPNPMCKIKVYAAFELRLGGSLEPIKNYEFPLWLNTYMPHPHLDAMACLGGNSQYINEAMSKQDYIIAISQTMAATRNIYFGDNSAVKHLLSRLRTEDPVCIEMRTGEIVRPSEAVKMLNR